LAEEKSFDVAIHSLREPDMAEDKKQLGSYHRGIKAQHPENHKFDERLKREFSELSIILQLNKIVINNKLYARRTEGTLKGVILNLR